MVMGHTYGILGPPEVRLDGEPLPLPAGRLPRVLLAVLLLRANDTLSASELIDYLWPDEPPGDPERNLWVHLSNLRRMLRHGSEPALRRVSGGYQLAVPPGALDSHRFQALSAQGRAALAAGEADRAGRLLRQALHVWRGDVLEGVAIPGPLEPVAAALRGQRLEALTARVDADLALDRHADLVGELEALAAANPTHEGLRERLMLALYRAGRQLDALTQYQALRGALSEEYGIEPGQSLRRLQQRILLGDPILDPPGDGERPGGVPSHLPPDIPDLTGRDEQVATLRRLLTADPGTAVVVTVVGGAAGIGKTALAIHVAHELSDHFPDGQLHVDLRGAEAKPVDPADVLDGFLRSLGVTPQHVPTSLQGRERVYRDRLAGRRILVVLDNAADVAQVRPLLPGSPSCAVLVTSRHNLDGLTGAHRLDLGVLTHDQALTLLRRIVGEARVDAEPEAAGAIVAACGRLPLAVRIVGARLASRAHWSLARMAARLADEGQRLAELVAGDLAVRASFELAYRALGDRLRSAFRLLGLVPAPDFAAWTLAALLDVPVSVAEDLLEGLIDIHLVEPVGVDQAGQDRYRFHDLLRAYARDRLAEDEPPGAAEAALRRLLTALHTLVAHADTCLGSIDPPVSSRGTPAPWTPDPTLLDEVAQQPLSWLASERIGVRAAVKQAHDRGWWSLAVALSISMQNYWDSTVRWSDWEWVLRMGLDAAIRSGDRHAEATCRYAHGGLATSRAQMWGQRYLLDAHRLFSEVRDRHGQAAAIFSLGEYAWVRGQHAEAAANLRWALEVFRVENLLDAQATTLRCLGRVYLQQGKLDEAEAVLDESEALCRKTGNGRTHWAVLYARSTLARARGDYEEALGCAERGLALVRGFGAGYRWEPLFIWSRGESLRMIGRLDEALRTLEQALRLCMESELKLGELYATLSVAFTLLASDRPAEAAPYVDAAERLVEIVEDRRTLARYLLCRGELLRRQGRPDEAVPLYERARRQIIADGTERHLEIEVLFALGRAHADAGRAEAAVAALRRAADLAERLDAAVPTGLDALLTRLR
jgi:DNA-binding SARP family transcriptional activator/predicted negative regulator of RcsB-dependent stress response